ncbi:MAG: hypothetical protein HFACDABA_01054 [Anaerolineales bacterium]|nr:hypothetical protein [Anaerolineales bacterium]
MKTRTLPILLAIVALVSASLACAIGGELSLSNARASFDQEGKQATTTFSPNDTVYVVADLSNAPLGTVVTSKWFALNAEGMAPNELIDEADINVNEDNFSGTVYFYFPPSAPWPSGSYAVELYLNGALTTSVTFSVP